MPIIKRNFSLVILGIIIVSALPVVYEWYKARKEARQLALQEEPKVS
jgi:membrane-associated protein